MTRPRRSRPARSTRNGRVRARPSRPVASSIDDISSSRRGGLRSHSRGGRTHPRPALQRGEAEEHQGSFEDEQGAAGASSRPLTALRHIRWPAGPPDVVSGQKSRRNGSTTASARRCTMGPIVPATGLDDAHAALEVVVELVVEHGGEVGVEDDQVDLLVEGDGAGVEVGRADVGHQTVDGHDLGVEHRGLEVPDRDAVRRAGASYSASPASCTNRLSACGPGRRICDVDAPVGGVAQPVARDRRRARSRRS